MRNHAFSAIELLIAISLGTMVLLTGYSAIRVAATSISTGNRLINENGLLRQTMITGIEQADFGAPGELGVTGTDQGLVYRAATSRAATSILNPDGSVIPQMAHLSRKALAMRPIEDWWGWRVNLDGKGWSYNDGTTAYTFDPSSTSPGVNRPVYQRGIAGNTSSALRGMSNGTYQAMANWGKGAQLDLYNRLGYWAMLEYMPPNGLFYCAPLTRGQIPSGVSMNATTKASLYGKHPILLGKDTQMQLPMASGSPWELAGRIQFQKMFARDVSSGGVASLLMDDSDQDWFGMINGIDSLAYAKNNAVFIPSGKPVAGRAGWDGNWQAAQQRGLPAEWPRCGLIIQRAWTDALRLNRVEVKLRSPITGQDLSISFNCLGSDLPGMRKSHGLHD